MLGSTSCVCCNVKRVVRCVSVEADSIAATGVLPSKPAWVSSSAICFSRPTPIRITMVSTAEASLAQSTLELILEGSSCPVTIATEDEYPRWVRGIPADAGPARADETPGIISNRNFSFINASASSPPREKMNGSPPFSLTTSFPDRACSMSNMLISA